MRSSRRRFSQAAVAVVLMAGALVLGLGAGPAAAHAVLERMIPADQSTVAKAPTSVSLIFDEAPRVEFSTVHVTGPDGQRRDAGAIQIANGVVTENLSGTRPTGRYVVYWRVISDDGHPVSGQFTFTARADAEQFISRSTSPPPANSSSSTAIVIVVIVAVLLVAGGVAFFWRRRLRTQPPAVHE